MPTFYIIELFSGTGSFSAAAKAEAKKHGFILKKLSVDIHPKYNPSTCIDIRKWNYKQEIDDFLPNTLGRDDIIWVHASPPCNDYSSAKTNSPRNLEFADSLVKRALKIIKWTNPDFWTVENPVGLLHTRPFMRRLERFKNQTSYCRWGRGFRKNTHIWSNVPLDLPVCKNGSYCPTRAALGHHSIRAQKRDSTTASGHIQEAQAVDHLYGLPAGLVRHVIRSALQQSDAGYKI